MNEYIEFEGKNLEKAIEKASLELKQDVSMLKYDVVSHGSSGIFGLVGVKKAKIRVQIQKEALPSTLEADAKIEARNLVQSTFDDNANADAVAVEVSDGEIEPVQETSDENLEQAISVGNAALTRLVNALTEGAAITVDSRKDRILYKIDGGNSAVIIGKRGQTLEAIQYLVEKIANKPNNTRIRVLVDVKGYLGARKTSLKKLASKMAEKAAKTNKPVTVGQMNAYDRRIVHMSLKDNQDVRTQSMGEGYYRKLVIFPKKKRSRKTP
jgi:spoIIIJ-associated protein